MIGRSPSSEFRGNIRDSSEKRRFKIEKILQKNEMEEQGEEAQAFPSGRLHF
jgi:hypothetical protein